VSLSIRPPIEADFATIAAITNVYIATTTIHFGYDPITADDVRAMVGPIHPWLVGEVAGEVVAYAKAGTWRERAAYRWTVETGVYVAAHAHRRGHGRAIYSALLAELAHRGFHTVVAGITLPNDASIAMHEAMGFQAAGVVREAGFKFDRWHDVGFWQKSIS
jgi:L-amino acid N-acyltransferase YncA